ncbi:MAG: tol-pal system-associated acyl-CoA thioesterase [Rhodospirillales bacterium 70-18]|nr:tol-pal system-associated acyl-CoA thioesterase [Rhodospirillales bacterium]OJY64792.1 MAG: tol-pal system-associated acyl-CoA thioesterase [Rhodospirillales bacterium 70-18]
MIVHPPAASAQGRHAYALRVYYEDTDAGGVVYHANYLRFAERARTEALREAGAPHAEMASLHGLMFMVRRVKVDYLAPARLDDSLLVLTESLSIRAASVELRQSVLRGEGVLAVLELQLACVRLADGRPGRIPPRWRQALALGWQAPALG